jgi:hypothetical protein
MYKGRSKNFKNMKIECSRSKQTDSHRGTHQKELGTTIRGGLSIPAIADYLCIWRAIQGMALTEAPDQLIWTWASDGKFTVHSAYEALHSASHPVSGCIRIWESWAPLRVKLFLFGEDTGPLTGEDMGLTYMTHASFVTKSQRRSITLWLPARSLDKSGEASARHWVRLISSLSSDSIVDRWDAWRSQWIGNCKSGSDSLFALIAWEL